MHKFPQNNPGSFLKSHHPQSTFGKKIKNTDYSGINFNNLGLGFGMVTQSIKCLLHKYEDPSSISRNPCKLIQTQQYMIITQSWEGGDSRCLRFPGQQRQLTWQFQANEKLSQKIKVDGIRRMSRVCTLVSTQKNLGLIIKLKRETVAPQQDTTLAITYVSFSTSSLPISKARSHSPFKYCFHQWSSSKS